MFQHDNDKYLSSTPGRWTSHLRQYFSLGMGIGLIPGVWGISNEGSIKDDWAGFFLPLAEVRVGLHLYSILCLILYEMGVQINIKTVSSQQHDLSRIVPESKSIYFHVNVLYALSENVQRLKWVKKDTAIWR